MTDYTSIANRAVEIIGSADPAQYEAAYNAMILETTVENITTEVRITEAAILSGLGLSDGAAFIDKLAAALHPSVMRLLQNNGINVIDAQSKAAMSQLLASTITSGITQAEYDWVASHYTRTIKTWPGLKPGHVQNALEYRLGGLA